MKSTSAPETPRFRTLAAALAACFALALAPAAPGQEEGGGGDLVRGQQIDILSTQALSAEQKLNQAAVAVTETQINLNKAILAGDTAQVETLRDELAARQADLNRAEQELAAVKATLGTLTESIQKEMKTRRETIKAGDAVEVFVVEDEAFNGVYQVRQGGYVLVPQLGRVFIAGLTQQEAEQAISQALSKSQIKNATVLVERPTNAPVEEEGGGFIYLGGQFKDPGHYLIPANTVPTVVNTVIENDPTAEADLSRVRLLRLVDGRSTVDEIDVLGIVRGKGLDGDIRLNAGDILYIPVKETTKIIYVTGRVKEPGELEIPLDETLTAYSAILRAGGFERFANLKRVYIVRETGGGQKSHLPVDIRKVRLGLTPDVELRGKDIVVVPEKFFSL